MSTRAALFLIAWASSFLSSADASARDGKTDLLIIATRYVSSYTKVAHKAGDRDGEFIEDFLIPAIRREVGGGALSKGQVEAVVDFILVSDSFSNEEVSEISWIVYANNKSFFCEKVGSLASADRQIVNRRVKSGMAESGVVGLNNVCA